MDSVLRKLCEFAQAMRSRQLTSSQKKAIELRILDTLGCGVAGSAVTVVEKFCAGVLDLGGSGPCTVFGLGKAPVDRAALLNGFMTRYLDCNDTYLGVRSNCHPSDVIPAALAVAEAQHRSGEDALRAVVAGYHVLCALSDASDAYDRGWDHVGFGAVAVAVESAMLLDLSPDETAHAISLAIVPQNGLRQTRTGALSHWKGIAFANAAAHAVLSTYLAANGTTGPGEPFEGKFGVIAQVSGPIPLVLDPERDRTAESEFKLFPIGNGALGPVELALDLRPRMGAFASDDASSISRLVDEIEVRTYKAALAAFADTPDKWTPATHETADHSLPFLFALALGYGRVDMDAIDRGMHDAAILELTLKVRTVEDPAMTARFPSTKAAHVRIGGTAGVFEGALEAPLGNPMRPLTPERIVEKFHANADPVIGVERATILKRRILELDRSDDVAGLLDV